MNPHQHPLRNPKWRMLGCRISGLGIKKKVFLEKTIELSPIGLIGSKLYKINFL
jgi:hypothetical protein